MTMVHQYARCMVIGSSEKVALTLIEITAQIASPPNENGAELYSMIVHTLYLNLFCKSDQNSNLE